MSAEAEAPDAEEPEEEQAPEGGRRGCLSAIVPTSTPGCASTLMAVFLVVTFITVLAIFWWDPDNIPWRHAFSWWRILAIIALMFAIPLGVYKTVSLWMEGAPNAFPDLDYAWRAGMHALETNELSIDSVPLFVITGSSSETQEKSLMSATGMRFSVEGVPQGPAPIHWYANSEAIYLFCSDASWTSALASLREEIMLEAAASGPSVESPAPRGTFELSPVTAPIPMPTSVEEPTFSLDPPPSSASSSAVVPALNQPTPSSSLPPGGYSSGGSSASGGGSPYRGTLVWPDAGPGPSSPPAQPNYSTPIPSSSRGGGSGGGGGGGLRGTLILGDGMGQAAQPTPISPAPMVPAPMAQAPIAMQPTYAPPPTLTQSPAYSVAGYSSGDDVRSRRKPVLLSHQYSTSCLQELQHLGQLLKRARQPLCTINGVLALIQFESIHATPAEVEELQKAIRADMDTIQHAFQMRVPVSALIVGLEKERGFRELVLRVGKERAFSQRFGRRFDLHALPSKEELAALTTHVCGVFEDWAYSLFREEDSLMRPGNTRLYELLSTVRCEWKLRLSEILCGGFGCDSGKHEKENSLLFSGCYFAATGETPDRQAFVKGVVDKLNEEQELIEWTPEALRSSYWQNIAANLGMIVTLALIITLALMFWLF